MTNTTEFTKDPQDILDYQIDWSDWLNSGEVLLTSTWTVSTGITKDSDTFTATTTTVWLSGGSLITEYVATNHIVTNQGRAKDQSLTFYVYAK